MVERVFNEKDRALITSISSSRGGAQDSLFWRFEAKGQYSVHSAYRFLTWDPEIMVESDVKEGLEYSDAIES